MEAIILAGGFGSRLRTVVKGIPKPMADINGRPFLSLMMAYLSDQECIDRILLSVGYKYEVIQDYFGIRYRDLDIEYVIEREPLGTGGAIREAMKRVAGREAAVLNGDTFFKLDLKEMLEFHRAQGSVLTMAVRPEKHFDRYGSVVIEGNRIKRFEEKSFKEFGYINGGVYLVNTGILEYLEQLDNNFSFEGDFLQKNIDTLNCSAFISSGYFIDIGIPEDYERARGEMAQLLKGAGT